MTTKEKVVLDLTDLRITMESANKTGKAGLAVVSYKPDGSGKITSLGLEGQFLEDLAGILESPPITDENTKEKVMWAITHLRVAVEIANEIGQTKLAIGCYQPDGSGKIAPVAIDGIEFLENLVKILELPPITESDRKDFKADLILAEFTLQ